MWSNKSAKTWNSIINDKEQQGKPNASSQYSRPVIERVMYYKNEFASK